MSADVLLSASLVQVLAYFTEHDRAKKIYSEVAIEFDMLAISREIIKETSQNMRLSKMRGFYSFCVHNNKFGPQVKKHLLQVRNKLRSTESNMKPLSSQHFRGPLILKLVSLFLENYLQSLQNKNTIS